MPFPVSIASREVSGALETPVGVFESDHDLIDAFEESLVEVFPLAEEVYQHHFGGGVYARELFVPAGTMMTSMVHKGESIATCSMGSLWVWTSGSGEGFKKVNAPYTTVSPPGTRRVGVAETDVIWTTYHAAECDSVEEMEKILYEDWSLDKRKRLESRAKQIQGHKDAIKVIARVMDSGGVSKCLE